MEILYTLTLNVRLVQGSCSSMLPPSQLSFCLVSGNALNCSVLTFKTSINDKLEKSLTGPQGDIWQFNMSISQHNFGILFAAKTL